MKHASLFTGIGGFDLAAQWMGWENVFQVEIDKFCQKVLEKNFPNVKRYGDIKEFDGTEYSGQLDVLTGGFPCQPFSVAGKRKGAEDDRFLWHEMLRAIREVQPTWIIAENVGGLLTQGNGLVFEQVCAEMEKEGYEVQPLIIPAAAVNAPHRRDRIWFIAHNNSIRCDWIRTNRKSIYREVQTFDEVIAGAKHSEDNATSNELSITNSGCGNSRKYRNANESIIERHCKEESANKIGGSDCNVTHSQPDGFKEQLRQCLQEESGEGKFRFLTIERGDWNDHWYEAATRLCRVDARIPNRVDRLKSLGNSIVPQVAYEIFKAISNIK